jgi:DNA helicase IV
MTDPLDKLLADLKAEYVEGKPAQSQPQPTVAKPMVSQPKAKSSSLLDSLLDEVKAQYEEEDKAEQLRRQQQLQEQEKRQQQLKAQKLEELQKKAQAWLEELDAFSPEGLWFERFAEGYPSKLEAAVEYLQGLEDK